MAAAAARHRPRCGMEVCHQECPQSRDTVDADTLQCPQGRRMSRSDCHRLVSAAARGLPQNPCRTKRISKEKICFALPIANHPTRCRGGCLKRAKVLYLARYDSGGSQRTTSPSIQALEGWKDCLASLLWGKESGEVRGGRSTRCAKTGNRPRWPLAESGNALVISQTKNFHPRRATSLGPPR